MELKRIANGNIKAKEAFEVFLQQDTFDARTVEIHGILKKGKIQRIPEIEGLAKLLKLLENAVLVAHHVRFDVGMQRRKHCEHHCGPSCGICLCPYPIH